MRMGKVMKEILEALKNEPLTFSEIIVRAYGRELGKYEGYNQVASAIVDEGIGYSSVCYTKVISRQKKKEYHPNDYANVVYATFSRALKTLKKNGYVVPTSYPYYSGYYRGKWKLNVKNTGLNDKGA